MRELRQRDIGAPTETQGAFRVKGPPVKRLELSHVTAGPSVSSERQRDSDREKQSSITDTGRQS